MVEIADAVGAERLYQLRSVQCARRDASGCGQRGGSPGCLTHGDAVTGDAVAGVRLIAAGDAASGDQKPFDLLRKQG